LFKNKTEPEKNDENQGGSYLSNSWLRVNYGLKFNELGFLKANVSKEIK
jgi:hypothetical protein